jgi:hypothetical protein
MFTLPSSISSLLQMDQDNVRRIFSLHSPNIRMMEARRNMVCFLPERRRGKKELLLLLVLIRILLEKIYLQSNYGQTWLYQYYEEMLNTYP